MVVEGVVEVAVHVVSAYETNDGPMVVAAVVVEGVVVICL